MAIGRINSQESPDYEGYGMGFHQYNLLRRYSMKGNDQYIVDEFALEKIRQSKYPNQVSRLTGVYFFETKEDAIAGVQRWGEASMEQYISEVTFTPSKITRVDSEWVTWNLGSNNSVDWMHKYWRGDTYGTKPLREIIAIGTGVIHNLDLRKKAYEKILEIFPTATPLLSMAVCAYQTHSIEEIALTKSVIIRTNQGISGRHVIKITDLKNNEAKIIDSLDLCRKRGEMPPVILPKNQNDFFTLPDMRKHDFDITNPSIIELYDAISRN